MEKRIPTSVAMEGIDPERGRMPYLWEDDPALETCPVRVPLDQWQSFLRRQRETWEALEDDYPEDPTARRQALHRWIQANQPEPIALSERIRDRLAQVREQMRIFAMDNVEYDEWTGVPFLSSDAAETYRRFGQHLQWLRHRLQYQWEPETAYLQALDRALWVAENLWADRASPDSVTEERLWDEAWRLEALLISRLPL